MPVKQVETHRAYTKDTETGNVVNSDRVAFLARKRVLSKEKKQAEELAYMKGKIHHLESMLALVLKEKTDGN